MSATAKKRPVMFRGKPGAPRPSRPNGGAAAGDSPLLSASSSAPRYRRKGVFRLLDLPPELRIEILEYVMLSSSGGSVGSRKKSKVAARCLPAMAGQGGRSSGDGGGGHDGSSRTTAATTATTSSSSRRRRNGDILNLFLTCHTLYAEAASIFYRGVYLDTTPLASSGQPHPLLRRSCHPALAPRRHIRDLAVRFFLREQMHHFCRDGGGAYAATLREIAASSAATKPRGEERRTTGGNRHDGGQLQYLRLEIASHFPSCEFWGGGRGSSADRVNTADGEYGDDVEEDEDDESEVPIILPPLPTSSSSAAKSTTGTANGAGATTTAANTNTSRRIQAPLFVTKPAFQGLLAFLATARIPKITLAVDRRDHIPLWCPFHRPPPSGRPCGGEWAGEDGDSALGGGEEEERGPLLKVRWKEVVRTYRGARVAAGGGPGEEQHRWSNGLGGGGRNRGVGVEERLGGMDLEGI